MPTVVGILTIMSRKAELSMKFFFITSGLDSLFVQTRHLKSCQEDIGLLELCNPHSALRTSCAICPQFSADCDYILRHIEVATDRQGPSQLAKVYRATSGPTHYSTAARWWLPSTAFWRGCNSADDGSDVALTPTDRRRPANGPHTICSLTSSLFHIDLFFT